MGPGTSDSILGVLRTRYHWLPLAVCLGGGLRSPIAFQVIIIIIIKFITPCPPIESSVQCAVCVEWRRGRAPQQIVLLKQPNTAFTLHTSIDICH